MNIDGRLPDESPELLDVLRELVAVVTALKDRLLWGYGTPEGAVPAPVGTLYLRLDGSTSTTLYVKTSGAGDTGWTGK